MTMRGRRRTTLFAIAIIVLILLYIQPDVQLEEWEGGEDQAQSEG